ncbi:MAG: hypothetical protein IPI97_05680 [Nitrosomonas sp.]|nr:hypothetical protein [Nitrosomonas sp.]
MSTQVNRVKIAHFITLAFLSMALIFPIAAEAGRGHHRHHHKHHHHDHHLHGHGGYGGYGYYGKPRYNNYRYTERHYYSQPYTYYAPAYSGYYYEAVPGNFYLGINAGNGNFMLGY